MDLNPGIAVPLRPAQASPSNQPGTALGSNEFIAQRAWTGHIAATISLVASPPVLATLAVSGLASTLSSVRAWLLAGVFVSLAIIGPLAYLVLLQKRGRVTDLDVQLREQRMRPMLFTLACSALAWLILAFAAAPSVLLVLTGALWLQMAAVFCITLRWKISVHCSSAATLATVLGVLMGAPFLLAGVPLIAWSRVRLRRHTLGQTIAGALLGCIAALLALVALVWP